MHKMIRVLMQIVFLSQGVLRESKGHGSGEPLGHF